MKINTDHPTILSNVSQEGDIPFSLDTSSAVIFEILRSRMYSDPINSICRELLSNARDANREVGNADIPVRIWVPGPYLAIEDNGPGISPARMQEIYCVYGASTKRDDNSQTGGFGLGAKTPFAYGDTFTISTRISGTKYEYVAYIDETKVGKVKLLNETPTDEPNGTTIKVPVKRQDTDKFRIGVEYYTQFWSQFGDAEPKFVGHINPKKYKLPIKGTNWAACTNRYNRNVDIIVDGIPYYDNHVSIPVGVTLTFKTGEVDLTSNREKLHHSEKTNRAILSALGSYRKEIGPLTQQQINNVDTFEEVIELIESLPIAKEPYAISGFGVEIDDNLREWKGHTFEYPLKQYNIQKYYRNSGGIHKSVTNRFTTQRYELLLQDKDELKSYDTQRIRQYMNDNGVEWVFVLPPNHNFPVNPRGISTIKVGRKPQVSKKTTRTTVKCYCFTSSKWIKVNIDFTKVLYRIDKNVVSGSILNRGIINIALVVKIPEKEVKHIIGKPNWINIDDYIKTELLDKFTKEELQKVVNNQYRKVKYKHLYELRDISPEFEFFNPAPYSNEELIKFAIFNDYVTPEDDHNNIFKRYPMLRLIQNVDSSNLNTLKEYIKMVDSYRALTSPQSVVQSS